MKEKTKNVLRIAEIGCLAVLAVKAAVDLAGIVKDSGMFPCGGCGGCDGPDCRFFCCGADVDPDMDGVDRDGPCEADFDE